MMRDANRLAGVPLITAAAILAVSVGVPARMLLAGQAQGRGSAQAPAEAPRSARSLAPIDLTGTWVSVVTEDWRYRMMTPAKGDYAGVPLNNEARRVADMWDPAKDQAAGNACRSYGAPAIMRVPGRVKISWKDDNTLQIETDAGQQIRVLHFSDTAKPPAAGDAGWQGLSKAEWEYAGGFNPNAPARGAAAGRGGAAAQPRGGSLKVVTTKIRPGYLRKNGVPYSENAVVTEYFDRHEDPSDKDHWFSVVTIVDDPKWLNQQFITSTHFKQEANDAKWKPEPCSVQ